MSYSDLGTNIARVRALRPQESVGTAPTLLYDRMRSIDASAKAHDLDVDRFVSPTSSYVAGWKAWDAAWMKFFADKTSTSGKLANIFYLDALEAEIEQKRRELEGWIAQYRNQVTPTGEPVPAPTAPTPGQAIVPEPPQAKEPTPWWMPSIPWWAWALGGVAVVGGGYLFYRESKRQSEHFRSMVDRVYGSGTDSNLVAPSVG